MTVPANRLEWRKNKRGRSLHYGKSGPLCTIIPDSKWPGMFRVTYGNHVTDMVNASRASDCAISIALAKLNQTEAAA